MIFWENIQDISNNECFVNAKLSKRFLMKKDTKVIFKKCCEYALCDRTIKHFTAVIVISNRNKL